MLLFYTHGGLALILRFDAILIDYIENDNIRVEFLYRVRVYGNLTGKWKIEHASKPVCVAPFKNFSAILSINYQA